MTSLKTSIKTITYLSDIGCLEIHGASLLSANVKAIAMLIGHLPVALFFMISGFLFYFVAASKKPLIPFFKGRLLRIYPPV
ncbi:acyltransferase family protein, partial [Klebsiella pneumoniae]|uniref:acyltransferase family protein n=1 Tax=Klebsiella pneumoniae TaxID=573 RepID=UPI003D310CCF